MTVSQQISRENKPVGEGLACCNDVMRPGLGLTRPIREDHIGIDTPYIVLKFRPIPTRIAGEDAFQRKVWTDRQTESINQLIKSIYSHYDTSTDNNGR